MRLTSLLVGLILLCLCGGCGGSSRQSVTPAKNQGLKEVLQQLSESGDFESLKEVISTKIEDLEAMDAAKSKELAADYLTLLKSTAPAALKAQAKKMADKL